MRTLVLGFLSLLLAGTCIAADKKISELTSGSPLQATDMIPIARGAANFRLAGSDFTPKEVDCSDFLGWSAVMCDSVPQHSSVQRSITAPEWSTGYWASAYNQTMLNVAPAALATYPSISVNDTSVNLSGALSGAQYPYVYGVHAGVWDSSSGASGGSWISAIHGFASLNSTSSGAANHNVVGVEGTADLKGGSGNRVIGVSGRVVTDNTPGTITGFMASVYASTYGAKTYLPADLTKVYKFYALETNYGRNYFGQPDDAGLYAAEVVGDKGLLAGGANGQFQLSDVGSRPTCDAAHRGSFWYEAGGVGVADTVEVCRKDSGNAYAWVSVI